MTPTLARLIWRTTRVTTRVGRKAGVYGATVVGKAVAGRVVTLPAVEDVPEGRMVDLPGRGRTFLVDVPGPTPDAPTAVLLHGLGCTAYLCWFGTIGELSRTHRVITFDQRWHGRGIHSERFRFVDCADDAAAVMDALDIDQALVVGYSMGGAVAQELWHRHPGRVSGLVLASTARNFRGHPREKLFFSLVTLTMNPLSRYAQPKVERFALGLPDVSPYDHRDRVGWGAREFRSTSAWSMPEVLGELGRFNSASWITGVDVPTAVVVTTRDKAIPARRQHALAAAIPGAEVLEAPGGHASVVMDHAGWFPVFLEAVADVTARTPARSRAAVG
ncbi:alpha/beta fold hydrolase [Nocardioides dilutus]